MKKLMFIIIVIVAIGTVIQIAPIKASEENTTNKNAKVMVQPLIDFKINVNGTSAIEKVNKAISDWQDEHPNCTIINVFTTYVVGKMFDKTCYYIAYKCQ